jgi:hypothetical protein
VAPRLTFERAGSIGFLFVLAAALASLTAADTGARVRLFTGLAVGAVAVGVLSLGVLAFDYDTAFQQANASSAWRYRGFTENPNTLAILAGAALLALFLALAKRRGELVLVGARETPGRPVLEGYSLELVDQLVSVVAASTVIAYSLYTFTARDSKALMVTIPFVIFGVFRYLLLVHRDDLGEEPEQVLLTDLPILVDVGLWIATAGVILALT